jgi:hypothetical protein
MNEYDWPIPLNNRTGGCTALAMNFATRYGHLDVIKFLHENRTEGRTTDTREWAVKNQ